METASADFLNGATQFKSRLLRALGWTVAHVPFFEWHERSNWERHRLLVTKLKVELDVELEVS